MTKKKGKVPKRIGGVKIPKELRRKGDALIDRVSSPAGREMLAAGLSMAVAAASAAVVKARAEREARSAPPTPPVPPGPPVPPRAPQGTHKAPDPQVIADAVGQAAELVLARLFGGKKAG